MIDWASLSCLLILNYTLTFRRRHVLHALDLKGTPPILSYAGGPSIKLGRGRSTSTFNPEIQKLQMWKFRKIVIPNHTSAVRH